MDEDWGYVDSWDLGSERGKDAVLLRKLRGPGTLASIAASLDSEVPDQVNVQAFRAGFFSIIDAAFGGQVAQ